MTSQRALSATRLLTLTGAGGCGKTRLAAQTAADVLDRFPDGAWWVELAPLADHDAVAPALGEAVGVKPLPGQSSLDAAVAHLADSRALIVLDNCEHLLDVCASATEALLHGCRTLTVLATSRAPLGVSGETDWRVPSLSLPSEHQTEPVEAVAQSDAVRLFIERAMKVRPNFAVDAANAPAIAQICHDLDGIPLAIELAAARVRVLGVERIASGLGDRFRLLTGGARSAMPRQQTLRASVDWSHELLSDDERVLFRRMAVFAGGWALDAVEEVCADERLWSDLAILDLLTSLVDKSLVVVEEQGASVRYRLLETVRQYALDRLAQAGEVAALRERHRDVYLALAERIAPHLEPQTRARGLTCSMWRQPTSRRPSIMRPTPTGRRAALVRFADGLVEAARALRPRRRRLCARAGRRPAGALRGQGPRPVGARLPTHLRWALRGGGRQRARSTRDGAVARGDLDRRARPGRAGHDPDVSRSGRCPRGARTVARTGTRERRRVVLCRRYADPWLCAVDAGRSARRERVRGGT